MTDLEERELQMADCVGCGYCCKKAPCTAAFQLDRVKGNECLELSFDGKKYRCGLIENPPYHDMLWWKSRLGIGAGCSSSLNSDRKRMKFPTKADKPKGKE